MKKNIKIESVDVIKQGKNEKTGKDWTLYSVSVSGDNEMKEFSTFNYQYKNIVGEETTANFEYDSKWKNWKEVSEKQAEESSKHEEILNALRQIYDVVDDIRKGINK